MLVVRIAILAPTGNRSCLIPFSLGGSMADEMKEYCYSFAQMQDLLADAQGRPMARATLIRKIHIRSGCPPFVSPRRGVYWFPKDLFADWIRKLPITFGAKDAS